VTSEARPQFLTSEDFNKLLNVSRETLERLKAYVDLLTLWNPRINLVSPTTLSDVWRRHILDSAQLYSHIAQDRRTLVDLGSGAGLPGVILAILGIPDVHLIEQDQRKVVFLREALRITKTGATIHPTRIDRTKPFVADVITSRALAPLPKLLELSQRFQGSNTICLFLKGQMVEQELTDSLKTWKMTITRWPSQSDPSGSILRLENISRDLSASSR
jgi:16S rRNA (guanine527-N7)-methyltransferase